MAPVFSIGAYRDRIDYIVSLYKEQEDEMMEAWMTWMPEFWRWYYFFINDEIMEKWEAWMPWFCILAGIAVMAYWIGKAYACRMRLLEMQLQHEEQMKKEEWERKLKCDELYKDQVLKEREEKIESLQKTVKELQALQENYVELMILYFYNLSDRKQPLTLGELKERADAFRHVCRAIKDKLESSNKGR